MKSEKGLIYFVQPKEGGLIKIGHTTLILLQRLKTLQTDSPLHLCCLGSMSGLPEEERALHQRFRSAWEYGEWFKPIPELLDYIKSNTTNEKNDAPLPTHSGPLEWVSDIENKNPLLFEGGGKAVSSIISPEQKAGRPKRLAAPRPWLAQRLKDLRDGWGLSPAELARLLCRPGKGRHYSPAAVRKAEAGAVSVSYLHALNCLRRALQTMRPYQVILLAHGRAVITQSPPTAIDCLAKPKQCACGCGERFLPNVPWRRFLNDEHRRRGRKQDDV